MVLPMILLPLLLASSFALTPRFLGPPVKAPDPTPPPDQSSEVCGDNEIYVCNSTACLVTCANREYQDAAGACKPYSGCVCIAGYMRLYDDATGPCVTEDQCPPSCPKGEHYVTDTNLCEKTCENRNMYDVMGPCQPFSKCVCDPGLLRLSSDPDSPCVNEEQCPSCQPSPCGYNELWTNNKQDCPPEICLSLQFLWNCTEDSRIPKPGCQCIEGHLRNSSNICIPIEECPKPTSTEPNPTCGCNEEWVADKLPCPPDSCDTLYFNYPCARPPIDRQPTPGCRCKSGYLRDSNGNCIPQDNCPPPPTTEPNPTCAPNEEWVSDNVPCPPDTCDTLYVNYPCAPPPVDRPPNPGCRCKSGYRRDSNGNCIPENNCPPLGGVPTEPPTPECGENEIYEDKKITCPPQSCLAASGLIQYLCAQEEPRPGCNCKKGYLRDADNVCIPKEKCPPGPTLQIVCGPNEVESDNKITCPPQTCEAIGRQYKCAVTKPVRGCNCIKGYLRNATGTCIPKDQCSAIQCGANATYTTCRSACPKTCAQPNGPEACIMMCKPAGCECNEGYVLNDGACTKVEDCPPPTCGPNSTYNTCPSTCPKTCEQPNGPATCNKMCAAPGCVCDEGYVLNNGVCTTVEDCPRPKPPLVCGPNEVESDNKITCPPQTCEAIGRQYKCVVTKPVRGCNCIKGYLRNATGTCIPKDQCTASCPVNEYYNKCKVECPLYHYCPVTDVQTEKILTCEPTDTCVPGCSCVPGYLRKSYEDPTCIVAAVCPPVNCTRPNEVWNRYPPACLAEKCEDASKPVGPCLSAAPNYIPRCTCRQGYYRNSSNICVPVKECPGQGTCDKNSTYVSCPSACPPTCEQPNGPEVCNAMCIANGCQCKPGYVKNNGKCIKLKDCPPLQSQCDANSTYVECPNPCPPTCEQPKGPQVCNAMCLLKGCQCKPGYVKNNGKCIQPKDCPPVKGQCDANSTYVECPNPCAPTCEQPDRPLVCKAMCPAFGCTCKKGYIEHRGKCIKVKDCPPLPGQCDKNSTFVDCPTACPPTCEQPNGPKVCTKMCMVNGCQCKPGYVKHNGKCIELKDCPPVQSQCGANAAFVECRSACPPTCEQPNGPEACIAACLSPGCQCNPGYVSYNGKCIQPKECPPIQGQCDANSTYVDCPTPCPPTCEQPKGPQVCTAACLAKGCTCKPGYVKHNGKCINLKDCPPVQSQCGANATFVQCRSACPPTCGPANGKPCIAVCLSPGCQCKPGYVSDNGKCIQPKDCPPIQSQCDANSTYVDCPTPCPPTCEQPKGPQVCTANCLAAGCTCKPGYVKHNGKCINLKDCPPVQGQCDANSTYVDCPTPCPPTCEQPKGPQVCTAACLAKGCTCKPGYVKHNGKCIQLSDCPPVQSQCGANATFVQCRSACPPTCVKSKGPCIAVCLSPGCQCKSGYVSDNGKCIQPEDCPPVQGQCDANSTYVDCRTPCPPTCEQPKGPQVCTANCLAAGCQCKPGYVKHNGKCIQLSDCPPVQGQCDANSTYVDCPTPCPPTCELPSGRRICAAMCLAHGCQCNPGYVKHDGKCIEWKDCPPVTCPANETNVYCKAGCPTDYCPVSDSRAIIACSPPNPCPSGCVCEAGYKRKSRDDPGCIKTEDCPPVVCTRPNEEWNPSPPDCLFERCEDALNPAPCDWPYRHDPQCTCKKGYYRNASDICVPLSECGGKCTGPNEVWNPTPGPCVTDRCEYVLYPPPCYPDPNPQPRCECQKDYYRNESNICVPVMECNIQCPNANETFVWCNAGCPTNYCPTSDSRDIIACDPPYPCPHGCACKSGYLRKSESELECIKSSDCPPVSCTRPNEVWNPSPPDCIRERCEDAVNPRPCDWNYPQPPQCMCLPGYYRNASDICVPVDQCPNQCDVPVECRPTCAVPNPQNCPKVSPASTNIDGCQCQKGYILSEAGGICIRIEDCPQTQSCNGDPHAHIMACPWTSPSTCSSPQASRDINQCENAGCVCESGYIYSEKDGKCITPDCCPGGDPCGPNGTFVDCSFRCPNQYCPQDDSGVIYACKPGRPCAPGCGCKINHLRLNYDDDRCIVASDCPPIECTRPNEEYNSCPDCLSEQCEDAYAPPAVCNTLLLNCQPKCVCKKGYFRDSTGICVPKKQCPLPTCPTNEVWDECPSDCLAENCVDVNNQPTVCNTLVPTECRPRCVCQEDYFRDSNGNCVPVNDCPTPADVCTSDCTPTCAVPNPSGCPGIKKPCCENGQILDVKGGKCIPIENCPKQSCNGDPNAVINRCIPCVRSTCANPEAQMCPKPCTPGCDCAPGYIRESNGGKCIKTDECPGGAPSCGGNSTFVNCKNSCPTDYCPTDDSRATIICETAPFAPCVSGCRCRVNHRLKSREEQTCIVSSECPPVTCTRKNEVWSPCPSACLNEYCEAAFKKPTVCYTLLLNCNPRCVCKKDHFRDENDLCIPRGQCPRPSKPCDAE